MAKPMQNVPHHSNCNCCGRQASFEELGRQPSGFGTSKSFTEQKRLNTVHGSTRLFEKKNVEKVGSANQKQRSTQLDLESTSESLVHNVFDVLTSESHKSLEITAGITEVVVERSMLQAIESRMKGTSRDKESLLEECLALKDALCDQLYHLQLHKVHHESTNVEQRKMEIQIQELEMAHGLIAPRTGHPSQLRARIIGLKCRQQEYINILTTLKDDHEILRKDPRCLFTKEATIERDIYAMEIRRLQKMIRLLRAFYHKICVENNEVVCLCQKISKLTTKLKSSQTNLMNTESIIAQMKKDIDKAKVDMIEAQKETRNAISKTTELESHSMVLQTMLTQEKEEGVLIQRQTSSVSEQTQVVKKDNLDRVLQAAIAIGRATSDENKNVKKGGKKTNLKQQNKDDSNKTPASTTTATTTESQSSSNMSPSTPKNPTNKEFDEIQANYLKSVGKTTNAFVEGAPQLKSPRAKPHLDLKSPIGDHSQYKNLQSKFHNDVIDAEKKFTDMMDKLEYGATRPKTGLEDEANQQRLELEALKKTQLDAKKWSENLTIDLDDKTLKSNEYIIDFQDSKKNIKITSLDKTPEALARKKAEEEEARARKEAEAEAEAEAAKQVAEYEAKRKKDVEGGGIKGATKDEAKTKEEVEEAARRVAEDEARRKKEIEEASRRDETSKKGGAEDEARRKKDSEEAARRAGEDKVKSKKEVEEAARRAAEDEARRKKEVEEARRRAAEDEARKKEDAKGSSSGGKGKEGEFFSQEMQGDINRNIREVLGHLEVISNTVQQKTTNSGTAESTAKEILEKFDKPE